MVETDKNNIMEKSTENEVENENILTREKAMGISLILKHIVGFLDLSSLKQCRLVCTTWAEWATQEIYQRDCCQITLTPKTALSEVIPTVETSPFGLPCSDFAFCFGSGSGAGSSTYLTFGKIDLTSGWLQKFRDAFPSLKHLTLRQASDLDEILPEFFRMWPDLHSLTFDVLLGSRSNPNDNLPAYVDSVLTGLPRWQWALIRASKYTQRFRGAFTIPPVSCLARLKQLTIDLVPNGIDMVMADCPITEHSCQNLFQLNPKIKLRVRYKSIQGQETADGRRLLECFKSVSSFVQVIHTSL